MYFTKLFRKLTNLFVMIRQIGLPTFFVTFTSAERLWDPLKKNPTHLACEKTKSSKQDQKTFNLFI
jgi:hypothetical protein